MMRSAAIKHIQRLCCLGLGGDILVPVLLRELHAIVPSHSNFFFWTDQQGNVVNGIGEAPTHAVMDYYFAEFFQKRELDVMPRLDQLVLRSNGVTTLRRFAKPELEHSDFYNEIFRAIEYNDVTYTFIKDGRHRPLGVLGQGFDQKYEPGAREVRILEALIPFIAHGLTEARPMDILETRTVETGLLIFDLSAQLQYMDSKGRELLYLATHGEISPRISDDIRRDRLGLPPELIRIVKLMCEIFQDGAASHNAPVWRCGNRWGSFTFRAYWLESHDNPNAMVSVILQMEVPMQLTLYEKVKALPKLTARQRDVCLYLACGHSREAIAERLKLSKDSVIWHTREVYGKLHVHNKEELRKVLLKEA